MAAVKTPADVSVNVKLSAKADAQASMTRLRQTPGVDQIERLFPSESDQDLASLYVLKVNAESLHPTVDQINQDPDVEYAEPSAPRRLIR